MTPFGLRNSSWNLTVERLLLLLGYVNIADMQGLMYDIDATIVGERLFGERAESDQLYSQPTCLLSFFAREVVTICKTV